MSNDMPLFYDGLITNPDSKVHVAHMGPTWVLSAPDGPHEPCYQGWLLAFLFSMTYCYALIPILD